MFSIVLLVTMTWDNKIYWYEGLILFVIYFIYFTLMFQNKRISNALRRCFEKNKDKRECFDENNSGSLFVCSSFCLFLGILDSTPSSSIENCSNNEKIPKDVENGVNESDGKLMNRTKLKKSFTSNSLGLDAVKSVAGKKRCWQKFFNGYSYPIRILLHCTVPEPKKHPKLFPLTFVMCIFWIGTNSYIVSWMITIIGKIIYLFF